MITIVPECIYFDYSPSHQNLFFSIIIFYFIRRIDFKNMTWQKYNNSN
jgi:hypothetical protein